MINYIKYVLLLLLAGPVMAANPGIICTSSTKNTVVIEPQKSLVRIFEWGQIVDSYSIKDIKLRFIETIPSIKQTTYFLEDDYAIVVEFLDNKKSGTGYAKNGASIIGEYKSCYQSSNIKR